jgi:hypothetical protein
VAGLGAGRDGPGATILAEDRPDSHGAGARAGPDRLRADRGREYLAFRDGGRGELWIELKDAPGTFAVKWLDVTTGKAVPGQSIGGGGRRPLTTPFPGPWVVHVKRSGAMIADACDADA